MKNKFKPFHKSKAQISVEYLIVIGISLAILVPGGYFFYSYSKNSNEDAIRSQMTQLGYSLITTAESIYGLAEGSMITLDLNYPKNIREIYVLDGKELIIRYELSSGMNEAVFFSKTNLSGEYIYPDRVVCNPLPCANTTFTSNNFIAPGTHQLKIESKINYVLIRQVK
ncbi:MAG: hypothetical protein ACP5OA_01665 [Candidatus Woesearchaeota archaeon]